MTITVVMMIGTFGAIWGATLATLRNENRAFYSSAMGANFFLLGATYTSMVWICCTYCCWSQFFAAALEECIVEKVGYKSLMTAAVSGASTGGLYAGLVGQFIPFGNELCMIARTLRWYTTWDSRSSCRSCACSHDAFRHGEIRNMAHWERKRTFAEQVWNMGRRSRGTRFDPGDKVIGYRRAIAFNSTKSSQNIGRWDRASDKSSLWGAAQWK